MRGLFEFAVTSTGSSDTIKRTPQRYLESKGRLIEVWFSILERQAIHRDTFGSVRQLTSPIHTFINASKNCAHPFIWTKTARGQPHENTANRP